MKQLVCIVTILTLFLQLASCSKDLLHTKVRTVQKDSEWWNETETVVTPEEIMRTVGDKAHDVFCHLLSYDEDSAILDFQVYAKKGEDISVYHLIRKYSYEGGLSGEIKLEDESYPDCVFISGGKYFAVICNYSENEKKFTLECFEMDFENGNLGVKIPFNVPEDKYPFLSVNGIISYENKRVYILHSTDLYGEGQYRVCVDDGSKVRSIIPEFGNNVKLESLYNLMLIDNKPVFLATVTENDRFKQQLCTVDISTMTIEISEVSQDIDVEMAQYVPGKGLFNCDNKKVYRIDLLSGSENEVMDLRNSYIGGSFDSEERVLYSSEDKTVIFAEEQALVLSGNLAQLANALGGVAGAFGPAGPFFVLGPVPAVPGQLEGSGVLGDGGVERHGGFDVVHMGMDISGLVHHHARVGAGGAAVQNGLHGHGDGFFGHGDEAGGFDVVFVGVVFADVRGGQHPFAFPIGDGNLAVKGHDLFGVGVQNAFGKRDAGDQHHSGQEQGQELLHNGYFLSID